MSSWHNIRWRGCVPAMGPPAPAPKYPPRRATRHSAHSRSGPLNEPAIAGSVLEAMALSSCVQRSSSIRSRDKPVPFFGPNTVTKNLRQNLVIELNAEDDAQCVWLNAWLVPRLGGAEELWRTRPAQGRIPRYG